MAHSFAAAAVLRGIDLRIGAGELLAVVGPSGAGKTTLLRILSGALFPARGRALVDGQCLADLLQGSREQRRQLRAHRSRLGFVHQDHALVPNLRVVQNVVAGRFGQRGLWRALRSLVRPDQGDSEEVLRVLERVGIGAKMFHRTDTLSGGQQQRVAIARALFQHPTALLADEPVASVDPARARALVQLLVAVAAEIGLTLVVSLHDLGLAREFFPRLVGLREGGVIFDGCGADLAQSEVDALYLLDGHDQGQA